MEIRNLIVLCAHHKTSMISCITWSVILDVCLFLAVHWYVSRLDTIVFLQDAAVHNFQKTWNFVARVAFFNYVWLLLVLQ